VPGPARILAVAVALAIGAGATAARAEPVLPPRVVHVPVGRVLPRGKLHGTLGVNMRVGSMLVFTGGLADLAELELGVTDDLMTCDPCEGDDLSRRHQIPLVAGFKLGVNQGTWHPLQPSLALGVKVSAGGRTLPWADTAAKVAYAYAAASWNLGGGVRLHGGATLSASRHALADGTTFELAASSDTIRPFAGVEVTPSFYPRTTLFADLMWQPELGPTQSRLRWIGGWGARYQALSWGSIELDLRHRQGDDLQGSTVLLRLNGVLPR
jgi:hypothetical protein